jgi:hypothetical protein
MINAYINIHTYIHTLPVRTTLVTSFSEGKTCNRTELSVHIPNATTVRVGLPPFSVPSTSIFEVDRCGPGVGTLLRVIQAMSWSRNIDDT